ncbi:MAG: hypothetical protein AAB632_00220 [Patescibacteria group bacterium]
MGILIAVVVITLVVAAIGAGVYVLIFRAKHKKEVMANSQTIGGGVPVYGSTPEQQVQGQPDFTSNMTAETSQPAPAPSPMMNDITGSGLADDAMAGIQQPFQPPAQEPSVEVPQEVQPSISRDFAPETTKPEVPTDSVSPTLAVETPSLDNALDLNQLGSQNNGGGSILDDTQTVAPISEMAKEDMGQTPDGDMTDFSVPVTKENESLEQVESELGEAAVSAQTETKEEPNETPAPQPGPISTPEPTVAPEPLVVPEFTAPTDAPVPQQPVENVVPAPDNVGGGQDTDTKEMNI